MTGNEKITVEKTHTDQMVQDELKAMLGVGKVRLTLGAIASLKVLNSPYILGGKVTEVELENAYNIVQHDDIDPMTFHEALQAEIDTAFRAFDIIVPEPEKGSSKTSEIEIFSPEWFADIVSQACQSMPSITYQQIWGEIPLTMVFHLAVSTARRNGTVTRRPDSIKEAIKQFKAMRERK